MILRNKISIIINRDCFMMHHYHIYFEKKQRENIRAYDVSQDKIQNHIRSTIGEYFEREVLTNNNPLQNEYVMAVNMIDFKVEKYPVNKFLFGKYFLDSCGMASHYSSEEIVKKAYLEFFERQSLIANYLYGIPGKRIGYLGDEKILEKDKYIKNYTDETSYYDISLSDNIKVVIAICLSEKRNAVGVGTSLDMKEAVEKAQDEVLQYFAVESRKHDCNVIEVNEKNDVYYNQFKNFSSEDIKKLYRHLFTSVDITEVDSKDVNNNTLNDIIYDNYEKLNMKPFLVMFPGREETSVKVVKVFDDNWFPHMRPGLYDEKLITRIGLTLGRTRINNTEWIPFA
ncbi:MAG: YcaO-like family protein [Lachnospiraceae bacterium]|nr:YcaO-like family protein [Lachnospiraceae bacterium]